MLPISIIKHCCLSVFVVVVLVVVVVVVLMMMEELRSHRYHVISVARLCEYEQFINLLLLLLVLLLSGSNCI